MIVVNESTITYDGKEVDLCAELTVIMHEFIEKGVCNKEKLLSCVDIACKSSDELNELSKDIISEFMSLVTDLLGKDLSGELMRSILNIKTEEEASNE